MNYTKAPSYNAFINEGIIISQDVWDELSAVEDNDGLSNSDMKKIQELIKKHKINQEEPVALYDYTVDLADMKKVEKNLKTRKAPYFWFTTADKETMLVFNEDDT